MLKENKIKILFKETWLQKDSDYTSGKIIMFKGGHYLLSNCPYTTKPESPLKVCI